MSEELPEFDAARDRRERRAALLGGFGWLLCGPLLVVAALRLVAHDASFELIVLNAMTTWLYLPAWLALAIGTGSKRIRLAWASAAVCLLHVVWLQPGSWVAKQPPPITATQRFRLMSANLLMVNEDTEGIVSEVLAAHPDLLVVQELSPHWQARFEASDLKSLFPYRRAIAQDDSFGIGAYSRSAVAIEELDVFGVPALIVRSKLGDKQLSVLNFHTLPPRTAAYTVEWNRMMERVRELVRIEQKPLILAGDLNTTPHARWYGELVRLSMRGAHEELGRGYAVTWPNGRFPLPPIRLDHFLVSPGVQVLEIREGEGRGSDHRPLIADFAL
ncbi:MAG: endonuclease/exonuclease/phosphatase family protein [Polyangiaceae bacterium]